MRLSMPILKKNDKLDIDNTTIDLWDIRCKLSEEYKEVVEAMAVYHYERTLKNLKNIILETFDLIQVCILILWRSHRKAVDFD